MKQTCTVRNLIGLLKILFAPARQLVSLEHHPAHKHVVGSIPGLVKMHMEGAGSHSLSLSLYPPPPSCPSLSL